MLVDGRFWFGVIVGVAGTYLWHMYSAQSAS